MQQGQVDALSPRSYMELHLGEPTFEHKKQILLGLDRLRLMASNIIPRHGDSSLLDAIRDHMATDEFVKDVLDHIVPNRASSSQSKNPRHDYNQFRWHDDLLFQQNLLYVPNGSLRLQVLQHFQITPMEGHFGIHDFRVNFLPLLVAMTLPIYYGLCP